jgi:hypothetical protein
MVFAAACQDDVTVPVEYQVTVRSGDPQTVVIEFTLPNGTTSEEEARDSWTSPVLDFEEDSPIGLSARAVGDPESRLDCQVMTHAEGDPDGTVHFASGGRTCTISERAGVNPFPQD